MRKENREEDGRKLIEPTGPTGEGAGGAGGKVRFLPEPDSLGALNRKPCERPRGPIS